MSLEYFYGLTNLGSGIVRDIWPYNASAGIGQFAGNSGSNSVSQIVSGNNFDDFSLYFTYTKLQSSFNSGGVALFSNYSGGSGFTLGIDAGNIPFLKTPSDCFSFDQFELGGKNCLVFQKSDNTFSLSRYDIPSAEIREIQSFFVSPSVPLSGGAYKFGTESLGLSGVKNFYGSVDQLLFVSERVSIEDSRTILSGFLNLPVVVSPFGTYEVQSSEWIIPNTGTFGTGIQQIFQDYFINEYQDYVIDQSVDDSTEYVSRISFEYSPPNHLATNYYGISNFRFCPDSAEDQMGDPLLVYLGGTLTQDYEINGAFTTSAVNSGVSPFLTYEYYFSYDLSSIQPGLRFSNLIRLIPFESVTTGVNSGYYSGFEMQGIFAPRAPATLLGTIETSFTNVGNEAVFDSAAGVFRATNLASGMPIYLNGEKQTGFIFSGGIIDILGYTETSADEVVYDMVSGLSLLSFSNSSSTTGNFYVGTSFAATGEFSFEPLYRIGNTDFYETHSYHLFHRKSWQETFAPEIFPNIDENWT